MLCYDLPAVLYLCVCIDLGPEFVFEALRCDPTASAEAKGRTLRFLANVDPVDVTRALTGLNPEETLVIIVSKTFTTAETMLNARTVKNWLLSSLPKADPKSVVSKHMVAVRLASYHTYSYIIQNIQFNVNILYIYTMLCFI